LPGDYVSTSDSSGDYWVTPSHQPRPVSTISLGLASRQNDGKVAFYGLTGRMLEASAFLCGILLPDAPARLPKPHD
ncbi:UNVERIFIED_CONTAM: hypothetical protein NY603_26030, partial [Bacteroidetes bacterium 56_B9]